MGSLTGNYFNEKDRLCKKSTQIWANVASLVLTKQILVPATRVC